MVARLLDGDEEKALKLENLVPACVALQEGTSVRLKDSPEKVGKCESFDWGTGDWSVQFHGGELTRLKPEALVPSSL